MTRVFIIPKNLVQKDDLVIIPRADYEEYLALKRAKFVKPTKSELKAIKRGQEEVKKGKYKAWAQVKNDLARLSY